MSYLFLGYILTGLCAGLLSGLLGLGGGIVIVPALIALFSMQSFPHEHLMHIATGTSLATILITSFMTTWVQSKRKAVQWGVLKWLIPGTVLGALCGTVIGNYLPGHLLKTAFAFFCLLLSGKMLLGRTELIAKPERKIPLVLAFLFAWLIGICAGLLGIGGGVLVIPFLLWCGLEMPAVSATSAASTLPTATSGALSSMVVGWHISGLPSESLGYVYWPAALCIGLASLIAAPIGVLLVHRLPVLLVKRIFGGILLIVAWTMMPSF
ncbi:MAG TPA: sulfite exporter TauE/SafE family protein [Candidatus Berkiella sp.]|nr:sulfite exporter TauE/SafE family protein [Candidatus Berkiella sp.]